MWAAVSAVPAQMWEEVTFVRMHKRRQRGGHLFRGPIDLAAVRAELDGLALLEHIRRELPALMAVEVRVPNLAIRLRLTQ
jgi:hypothetical protein